MKFSEKTMDEALATLREDAFWDAMYREAPEGAKKRLRVAAWYNCQNGEGEDLDAYRAYRRKIEEEMTVEDFQYLAERFPKSLSGRKYYAEQAEKAKVRTLRTPEKLDEGIDGMLAAADNYEKDMVEKTRGIFRTELKDDPICTYETLWLAVGGDGDSCCLLGDLFDHGHGVERDENLAFFWFRRGALSGNAECCYRLADLLEDPDNVHFNFADAMFWWSEGLRRNDELVKAQLAYRLAFGEGPWTERRNPELAVRLLTDCVSGKDKDGFAHYFLGRCYAEGVGVTKDVPFALSLLRISRERENEWAEKLIKKLEDEQKGA